MFSCHLHQIKHLTIKDEALKKDVIDSNSNKFPMFIATNFSNLNTLNVEFIMYQEDNNAEWDWNDISLAEALKAFPSTIKGHICFHIQNNLVQKYSEVIFLKKLYYNLHVFQINLTQYPDLEANGHGDYSKIFYIHENLTLEISQF